ncbi:hybrid sensor histidine kinase/response regulator [Opitutaceae bacterium EW11]|nr:hybrid sensor histidine kinase/response regulator [Opitutaceae bacterium EW11]
MSTPTRILVTEDEPLVAMDLKRRLEKLGFEVEAVVSEGAEAVAEAARSRPDLVLMDICLPGSIDGIEAAGVIREQYGLPVVYLTANSDETTLKRAKATGPASYLLKPFRERELHICIEMALENHRLQRAVLESHANLERKVEERTRELAAANEALKAEIAERRHAEAVAREQATLLDKARDSILVRDLHGRILYWNRSAEQLYGIDAAQARGKSADELLNERPASAPDDPREAVLGRGEWVGELVHTRPNGSELLVESRWTLVRDEAGQPKSILIVNTDVTEKRRLQAEYLRTQRLEGIGAVASGIAHDLNNVFTPLLVASQSLEEVATAEEARSIGKLIHGVSHRGAGMVRQILTFVRGGSSDLAPIRAEHLAKDVHRLAQETFPSNLRIRLQYQPGLWSVLADPTMLHQLMMNLMVNARDAMPDGGELGLQLSNKTVDPAFAALHGKAAPGDYVCISVSDTGAGITPEIRARIFEPFFTTKASGKGTGLGLSIVQTIVRDHRGFLDMDSAPGRGTRFQVFLPACEQAQTEPPAPIVEPPRGAGERLLVVDDEQSVREIVREVLEAHGYRVVVATDGVDAIARFAAEPGAVSGVISDYAMPLLDGLGCARGLRRVSPLLPLLLLSGRDSSRMPREQIAELNAALLEKPFTRTQLLAEVHRMLHPGAAQ